MKYDFFRSVKIFEFFFFLNLSFLFVVGTRSFVLGKVKGKMAEEVEGFYNCTVCKKDDIPQRKMSLIPGDCICFACAKLNKWCFKCGMTFPKKAPGGMCPDCYAEKPEEYGKCTVCSVRGRVNSRTDAVCNFCVNSSHRGSRSRRPTKEADNETTQPEMTAPKRKQPVSKTPAAKKEVQSKPPAKKAAGAAKGKAVAKGRGRPPTKAKKVTPTPKKGEEENENANIDPKKDYPYSTKALEASLSQKRQAQLAQDRVDYMKMLRKDRKKVDVSKYSEEDLQEMAEEFRKDRNETARLARNFLHPFRYTEDRWEEDVDDKPLEEATGMGVDDWRMGHELMVVVYYELSERFVSLDFLFFLSFCVFLPFFFLTVPFFSFFFFSFFFFFFFSFFLFFFFFLFLFLRLKEILDELSKRRYPQFKELLKQKILAERQQEAIRTEVA